MPEMIGQIDETIIRITTDGKMAIKTYCDELCAELDIVQYGKRSKGFHQVGRVRNSNGGKEAKLYHGDAESFVAKVGLDNVLTAAWSGKVEDA